MWALTTGPDGTAAIKGGQCCRIALCGTAKNAGFLQVEPAIRKNSIEFLSQSGRIALALSPLGASPRSSPDPLSAG